MAATTITITLELTVSRGAWEQIYDDDPLTSIPEHLAGSVGMTERLMQLPGNEHDGAAVLLVASDERTTMTQRQAGFVTVRVVLVMTVDELQWQRRWGIPPAEALGSYLAGAINQMRLMREKVNGTAVPVPAASGTLIAEETLPTHRK